MEGGLIQALNAERSARRAVALLSPLGDGPSRMIREGERVEGAIAEPVRKAFRSGKAAPLEIAGQAHFLNVYLPGPRLVVIGAVHISQALAPMAKIAGYPVEIVDPRTAFASPERFPDVTLKAEWPEQALAAAPLDAYTALAAVTHDPKIDDFALEAALKAGCFYVGALGSRKTHARRLERLRERGATEAELARIRAPIGLPIAASSPAEIAVAILAEIIQAFRSRGVDDREPAA